MGSPLRMLLALSYSSLRADITGFVLAQIDKNRNIVGATPRGRPLFLSREII